MKTGRRPYRSARFGAEVKQTAAVSRAKGVLRLVREVEKTAARSAQPVLAADDATDVSLNGGKMPAVWRTYVTNMRVSAPGVVAAIAA